ncbi:hypothetical protein Tcan_00718, partial [Toxocara canis]
MRRPNIPSCHKQAAKIRPSINNNFYICSVETKRSLWLTYTYSRSRTLLTAERLPRNLQWSSSYSVCRKVKARDYDFHPNRSSPYVSLCQNYNLSHATILS